MSRRRKKKPQDLPPPVSQRPAPHAEQVLAELGKRELAPFIRVTLGAHEELGERLGYWAMLSHELVDVAAVTVLIPLDAEQRHVAQCLAYLGEYVESDDTWRDLIENPEVLSEISYQERLKAAAQPMKGSPVNPDPSHPDNWTEERRERATKAIKSAAGMMFLKSTPEQQDAFLRGPADLVTDAMIIARTIAQEMDDRTGTRGN